MAAYILMKLGLQPPWKGKVWNLKNG
jgi:hypothetical protein